MKKYLLGLLTMVMTCLSWITPTRAAVVEPVVSTEYSKLYLDSGSVATVKRGQEYFLLAAVEERYTDEDFLAELHKDKELSQVVASSYLYLFDNRGATYRIGAWYFIDENGKVCQDMGKNMTDQPVDKSLTKVYEAALAIIEGQKRMQRFSHR